MACNIKEVKDSSISKAKQEFIGNSTTMRNNPTNVWIPYGFGRTKQQTYNMVNSNMDRVTKWAKKEFGEEYSEGWTEMSTGFSDGIKVNFKFPKNLEQSYINRNKAEEYSNFVQQQEAVRLTKLIEQRQREQLINEAALAAQEGDYDLDKIVANLFYNVNSPDAQRMKRIPKLDRLILKTVKSMGIDVKSMERYKVEYENKTGKKLTQLGIADITNNVLAYSQDDGVTLTEEAMHFIVFANWDTPEMKAIRDAKAPTGEKAIVKTNAWEKNFDVYMQAYNGDIEKVEKEIIGKLLAEYMYDRFETESKSVGKMLSNLIKNFLSIFRANTKNRIKKEEFTAELRDALDLVVDNIELGKYNLEFSTTEDVELVVSEENYFEKVIQETINNLQSRIIGLEERVIGLVGEDLTKFNDLMNKLGVKYKDIDAMKDALEKLKTSKTPLSPAQQQELDDISSVIQLNDRDQIDRSNVRRIERIRARIKELNKELRAKRFHAGLHLFILGADGKSGIRKDIDQIVKYIQRIRNGEINVYPENYNNIVELVEIYSPIVKTLNEAFLNRQNFTELTPEENKKLKAEVNSLSIVINSIQTNLKAMSGDVASQHNLQYRHLNPDIEINKKEFRNSSFANLWFGSLKNVKDDWGRLFHYEVNKIKNRISEIVNNKGVSLLQELGDSGINVDMKLLREKDENGNPNHYFLSEVKTDQYIKNEQRAREEAIAKVEEIARSKFNRQYNIPIDINKFYQFFNGNLLTGLDSSFLSEEMKIREQLLKVFNREMAIWMDANTKVKPNAEEIIKEKKQTLTKTQYNKWYNANIYKIENEFGREEYRFKGELVMPSTGETKEREFKGKTYTTKTVDYTNPEYERLRKSNPEAFRTLQILKKTVAEHKNFLHTKTYSWEREQRLPQVSKSALDIASSRFKGTGDLISEQLTSRIDDDYYGDRLDGALLRRPPIRYMGLINNPSLITDDLIRSTMLFVQMATHYKEFTRELPTLHGMIDAVNLGKVVDVSVTGKETVLADGSQSNLAGRMRTLMETIVYGETGESIETPVLIGGKPLDLNKVSEKLVGYVRDTNLLGNWPSIIVGYLSGQVVAIEEAVLGKFYSKSDFFEAKQEFAKSTIDLLNDFESPVKKSKIGVLAQYLDLVDGNVKSFSNLDKSRLLRVASQTANYGGWRLADIVLKGQGMIAISKGIRLIDGQWYTKSSFKGSQEEWNAGERLWDKVSVEDGKIKYDPSLTKEVIDLWKVRVTEVNSRIDTQITDTDKAKAYQHAFFRFFTIHMGWLYQGIGRGFKPKGYDYSIQSIEEGYWITASRLMLKPNQIINLYSDWDTLEDYERDNIKKLFAMFTSAGLIFALAYIINAIALDDDDEDDPFFRYMVYVLTRMLTESSARVSFSELLNYVSRPVAGLEKINNITAPIDLLLSMADTSDEITKGFYAGYTKTEQNFIKSVPLLRGLFENVYGGYVNEIIGKGEPSVAVNLKLKNQYMVNNVVNKEGWLLQLPYGLLSKVAGWLIARPIAGAVSSKPKSESFYKLPNKKQNKEEKKK